MLQNIAVTFEQFDASLLNKNILLFFFFFIERTASIFRNILPGLPVSAILHKLSSYIPVTLLL